MSALKKVLPRVDLDGHDLPPSPAPSSPNAGRRYALATELVYTEGSDQYNASSVPIYQVSTQQLLLAKFDTKHIFICSYSNYYHLIA